MTLYVWPPIAVNTSGIASESTASAINTKMDKLASGLVKVAFDYFAANYSGATTDVWTYKTGGSGGTTVATVTVTYVDSSKAVISSVGVV
jgi:hypothetical protein